MSWDCPDWWQTTRVGRMSMAEMHASQVVLVGKPLGWASPSVRALTLATVPSYIGIVWCWMDLASTFVPLGSWRQRMSFDQADYHCFLH